MEDRRGLLNEERYQQNKRKISNISIIVFIVGLLVGGSLILLGISKIMTNNDKYSDASVKKIENRLNDEENVLKKRQQELADKGITYKSSAKYTDGEVYEFKIIYEVLDPSFNHCLFDEYKDNSITKKYCSIKKELEDVNSDFNKSFNSHDAVPFFIFGSFIIIASAMISFSIFMFTKRREMMAFSLQQMMPIAQEGIEKMEPTITEINKRMMKNMGPTVGDFAKEISKGIKEGMNEADKNK